MKRHFLIPATLALAAAALFGACKATDTAGNTSAATAASKQTAKTPERGAPTGTTEVHADGIRRVNAAELLKMVEAGGVVIYDTRSRQSYEQEHVKGALAMPHEEVSGRVGEFPPDKTLVFYCT
jgi:3-mercaptopyruvate sulfurtransferase SseA